MCAYEYKQECESEKARGGRCVKRYWCFSEHSVIILAWAWEKVWRTGWTLLTCPSWQFTYLTEYLSGRLNVFFAGFEDLKAERKLLRILNSYGVITWIQRTRPCNLHYFGCTFALKKPLIFYLSLVLLSLCTSRWRQFTCGIPPHTSTCLQAANSLRSTFCCRFACFVL